MAATFNGTLARPQNCCQALTRLTQQFILAVGFDLSVQYVKRPINWVRGRMAGNCGERAKLIVPLVVAAALLALLPWVTQAQSEPPHVFIGTAIVNGFSPPTGTEVVAYDGATEIGSAFTKEGGSFTLYVSRASGTITFTVGGVAAAETSPNWTSGQITRGFALTATAHTPVCQPATSWQTEPENATEGHSHELPHVFVGQASIDGQPVAADTEISAWDGSSRVGITHSADGGAYSLQVARSYGPISFKINGHTAVQNYSTWTLGQITPNFNLTATSSANCLQGIVSVEAVVNALNGQLIRVFAFDNETKQWAFYDPQVTEFSDLKRLVPGIPYYFLVSQSLEVVFNGTNRELTCSGGNCWNLMVW